MANARGGSRQAVLRAAGRLLLAVAVALLGHPAVVRGATAGAHLDWTYGHSDTETRDKSTGREFESSYDQYIQRYGLNYSASLAPYLLFKLGYLFDTSMYVAETNGEIIRSETDIMSPTVDLNLANPQFFASAGFRRFEQRDTPGERSPTRDTYSASFGIKERERRPSLNILYTRYELYDETRLEQNTVNETTSFSTRYLPVKNLDLRYRAVLTQNEERISGFESQDLGQNARASYGEEFFDRRVVLSGNYSILFQRSELAPGGGGGEVTLQVLPVQGISGAGPYGTDVVPETPEFDTVVSKPLLINIDVTQPTDINIGYTPANTGFRNLGVVFATPTTLNQLSVVMNQDVSSVAGSYVWDVYTSTDLAPIDAGPKRWTRWQQAALATFNASDRRFEIRFPSVKAQFIKLVVRPLLSPPVPVPGIDFTNVLVTELEAYNRVTAGDIEGTTTRTQSQNYDVSLRTKIMNIPLLYYDFYYWHVRTTPDGISRYLVSNGITASHQFWRIFSGTLRGGRSDSDEREGHRTTYTAGASLTATPLPSLSHSLVLGRNRDLIGNESSSSWSAYLNNYAELYPGINLTLGIGANESTSSRGVVTLNQSLNAGATMVPHRTVSINLYHSTNTVDQHGGGAQEMFLRTTSDGAGVTYTPFPALFLTASRGRIVAQDYQRTRNESYSASWSPFAGGSLQLTLGYNQEFLYPSQQETTQALHSITWRLNPRMHLRGAYTRATTESPLVVSRTNSYDASLRWLF